MAKYALDPTTDKNGEPVKAVSITETLTNDRRAREQAAKIKENTTVGMGYGAATVQGTIGTFDRWHTNFTEDYEADYQLPDNFVEIMNQRGISRDQWPLFEKAHGAKHFERLIDFARMNSMAEQDLAQFHWSAQMAFGMADPGMLAVDVAAAPISMSAKAGRLVNMLRSGGTAAATNATFEAARGAFDPNVTTADVAMAAGTSFVLAGALGARKGDAYVPQERMNELMRSSYGDDTLSAARVKGTSPDRTPGVMPLRNETPTEQQRLDKAIDEAEIMPAFHNIRRDLAGRLGSMKSALTRSISRDLLRDGVGYTDKSIAVKESGGEFSKRHLAVLDSEFRRGHNAAWNDYKTATGNRWWNLAAKEDFNEQVGRAILGMDDVHPAAKAAAQRAQAVYAKALRLQQESGIDIGDVGKNYLPRVFSAKGFQRVFNDMGLDEDQVVKDLLMPAMRKKWADRIPEEDAAKATEIEANYKGTSDAAIRAREKADDLHAAISDRKAAVDDAEARVKEAAGKHQRFQNAAQRRLQEAQRKLQRAIDNADKAKAKLKQALDDEDKSRFAMKEAKKVTDGVLDEELLEIVARAWLKRAQKNFEGNFEGAALRGLDADDVDELADILEEAGVSDARSTSILRKLQAQADEAGKLPHAKGRIDLDETFRTKIVREDGSEVEVGIVDLLDTNIERVTGTYLRNATGWSAMSSKLGIKNHAQLNKLKKQVLEEASKHGDDLDSTKRMLDIATKSVLNQSTETNPSSAYSRFARFARQYQFARVMGQVGFSLFAELGPVIAQSGLKNFLTSIPHASQLVRRMQDGTLATEEGRVLEAMFAPGTDYLRNPPFLRLEDDAVMTPTFGNNRFGVAADNVVNAAQHLTSVTSGLAPMNTMMQRIAGRATLLRMMDLAKRPELRASQVQRLRNWGLDEKMQKEVFDVLAKANKIEDIPIDELPFRTREAMSAFMYRVTRQQVLEGDAADSLVLMHDVTGKLLTQFRSFMVNSYTRHFLNSFHNYRDWRTWSMWVMSTGFAGMGWSARTYINTIGDPEARKEQLTYHKLYANSFAQSSYSSIVPMVMESLWTDALGNDPMFSGARSTGMTQGLFNANSVPTVDFLNKLWKAKNIPFDILDPEREVTRNEVENGIKALILQNATGVRNIMNQVLDEAQEQGMFPDSSEVESEARKRRKEENTDRPIFPE